jgi:alkanesulfonate monooxygenase
MSGSSDAGQQAARTLGATAIRYPQPAGEEKGVDPNDSFDNGIRVGIIARENSEDAWRVAHERFPTDRKGQVTHQLAMKTSDSQWHKQLSEMVEHDADKDDPYWLGPFKNYKTFCPYLVGSYERVAEELARYIQVGFETFITDIPPSEEELQHTHIVFQEALEKATQWQS